jgi:hypothetical protein
LLGFGVNTAGEFCISYNVRMREVRACARSSHISTCVLFKYSLPAELKKCLSVAEQSYINWNSAGERDSILYYWLLIFVLSRNSMIG